MTTSKRPENTSSVSHENVSADIESNSSRNTPIDNILNANDSMIHLELEHYFPYQIGLLASQIDGSIAKSYEQHFGLSSTEWRVMVMLGRYPSISATEITEAVLLDKVAVSRAISQLMARSLVIRKTDKLDRRRLKLELSVEGQAIYQRLTPQVLEYEKHLLSVLTPEERALFRTLIQKLNYHGLPVLKQIVEADTNAATTHSVKGFSSSSDMLE